jgi:hypothetical protein
MNGILSRIKKGSASTPNRILLYGVEGIGKSTWAASAPAPIFICAEDGLGPALAHVDRIPVTSYAEVLAAIAELRQAQHDYKTVVIDTADWLEALIQDEVCEQASYEAMFGEKSYQRGYKVMFEKLRGLLSQLDLLRAERGVEIIMLAHALQKPYNNPLGDNFDRFIMKGNEKFTGLLKEWVDVLLFARYEVFVQKDSKKATKGKAVLSDARIMHTTWSPAWDAKNRLNLPDTLPLNYDAFVEAARLNLDSGGEQAAELAQYIVWHFETARWESAELKAKALGRLGGKLEVSALAKLGAGKLRTAADFIRALQPAPEEGEAVA